MLTVLLVDHLPQPDVAALKVTILDNVLPISKFVINVHSDLLLKQHEGIAAGEKDLHESSALAGVVKFTSFINIGLVSQEIKEILLELDLLMVAMEDRDRHLPKFLEIKESVLVLILFLGIGQKAIDVQAIQK